MQNNLLTLNPGSQATRYLYVNEGKIIATDTLAAMLKKLGKSFKPRLNTAALSHLLHHSVCPYPLTVYQGIHSIGIGDTAHLNAHGTLTLQSTFPYQYENCRADQTPSTEHLLKLLCSSLTNSLGKQVGTMMLSSGKDSVALALAASHAGFKSSISTITYAEEGSGSEGELAAAIAKKFGLKHRTIKLPTDTRVINQALTTFFTNSAQPLLDPVTPAYVLALQAAGLTGSTLIDGTGNDSYMGILGTPRKELVHQLTIGRFNSLQWLNNLVPFDSPLTKYLRPQIDHAVLTRPALRIQETSRIFNGAQPTNAYWNDYVTNPVFQRSYNHFFGLLRGYIYDGCHATRAREEFANAGNNRLILPWQNAELSNYYFNLPPEEKYDIKTAKNKLLLRKMLLEFADYDADTIGKRIFSFNQPQFLIANRKFVEEQILTCKLWNKEVHAMVAKLFDIIPYKPQSRYALMELFLISGWHNHSKYLVA